MAVYMIGFKSTIYHNEFIEASSKDDAERIARRLLENGNREFENRMYAGFGESACWDVEPCEAQLNVEDKPTITFEQLEEYLG